MNTTTIHNSVIIYYMWCESSVCIIGMNVSSVRRHMIFVCAENKLNEYQKKEKKTIFLNISRSVCRRKQMRANDTYKKETPNENNFKFTNGVYQPKKKLCLVSIFI